MAHESACCSAVGLDEGGFFVRTIGVPERAVHYVEGVAEFVEIDLSSIGICDEQLDYRGWVYYSTVPLAESAGSGCYWLLSDFEFIPEVSARLLALCTLVRPVEMLPWIVCGSWVSSRRSDPEWCWS